jgi:hypothetical protein
VNETALLWGVKASFSEYILRLPDGRFSATDGAEFLLPLTFAFESADEERPSESEQFRPQDAVLRFRGDVRFGGHAGALFLRIADPWLHFVDGGGFVSIVGGRSEHDARRRTVATFSDASVTTPTSRHLIIDETLLHADAVDLFNDAYSPGTRLDPLRVGDFHREGDRVPQIA